MNKSIQKIENPLTIIAIFAGITEVAASTTLPFLSDPAQSVFVWFLILFPFTIVAAFFITLNFNPKVLYAPGDYKDEKHFLTALSLSQDGLQVAVTSSDDIPGPIQEATLQESNENLTPILRDLAKAELDKVNAMFKVFSEKARELFESKLIQGYLFEYKGDSLFLITVLLKIDQRSITESRILRVHTSQSDTVELHIVGRNMDSSNPEEMANLLFDDLYKTILYRKKEEIE
jgi:hypothetical protein